MKSKIANTRMPQKMMKISKMIYFIVNGLLIPLDVDDV